MLSLSRRDVGTYESQPLGNQQTLEAVGIRVKLIINLHNVYIFFNSIVVYTVENNCLCMKKKISKPLVLREKLLRKSICVIWFQCYKKLGPHVWLADLTAQQSGK
jgi:hypothetical protein